MPRRATGRRRRRGTTRRRNVASGAARSERVEQRRRRVGPRRVDARSGRRRPPTSRPAVRREDRGGRSPSVMPGIVLGRSASVTARGEGRAEGARALPRAARRLPPGDAADPAVRGEGRGALPRRRPLAGFLHVALGQEAIAVGVCRALEESDVIASTHRAHAHALAIGMHPNELMAELYGKVEGCSRRLRRLDAPVRRRARADRRERRRRRRAPGDRRLARSRSSSAASRASPSRSSATGATNIGTFHESLNLAQLWKRARGLRLREQRLRGVDAGLAAAPDRRSREAGRGVRHALDHRGRPGRRGGLPRRAARDEARSRRQGPGVPAREHLPADRPLRRRSAGLPARRRSCGRRATTQDPLEKLRAGLEIPGRNGTSSSARSPSSSRRPSSSRERHRPAPEDALENVYA